MRVGVMDGTVAASAERVKAAREAIGPEIKLMADAHGTYSVPEAKQFCRAVEDENLYWFKETISPDYTHGMEVVRAATRIQLDACECDVPSLDSLYSLSNI